MSTSRKRRGDVESVELVAAKDRVKIRLHGHRVTYIARPIVRDKQVGPELAELTIVADEGAAIDYAAVRMIPARRLAVTAARLVNPADQVSFMEVAARTPPARGPHSGPAAFSGQVPLTMGIIKAATLAERALVLGQPVRPTVAAELGVSKSTVDRLLRQAKAAGLIEDRSLPRRPSPQQRDTTTEHWVPKGLIEDRPLPKRPPPQQRDTTEETD